MNVSSIGASVPAAQAKPPTSEANEAPGVNDHDKDDGASKKAAAPDGTGAIVDKTA